MGAHTSTTTWRHALAAGARRAALALALSIAVLGLVPSVASAAISPILVADDTSADLKVADDGSATLSLTFSNPGDTPLETSAARDGENPAGCTITPRGGNGLPAHREQAVEFSLTEECVPETGESVALIVTVGADSFDITAKNPEATKPKFAVITSNFLLAFCFSLAAMLAAYLSWIATRGQGKNRAPWQSLHGLESTWKFSDAWATNATVITAVFAGIFGAKEVTAMVLGESANDVLAMTVVAAAFALGLVGLGPMALQIFRRREKNSVNGGDGYKKPPAGFYFTPLGLLVAGVLTLTGTLGQLFVIVATLRETSLATAQVWDSVGVVATVVVLIYALQSTRQNLVVGVSFVPKEDAKLTTDSGTVTLSDVDLSGSRRGFGATL